MRNYASSVEKGNNNTITLHVYPGADGSFNLLEDDGTSNDYLKNIYASTIIEQKNSLGKVTVKINPAEGSFKGMKTARKWVLHIHADKMPKFVKVNNRSVKYSYNGRSKIAVIETAALPVSKATVLQISYSVN